MKSNIVRYLPVGLIATAFAAIITVAVLFGSTKAEACRDCPFPMKVGKDSWMMPNEKTVIHVTKIESSEKSYYYTVTLRDAKTNATLARGTAVRKKSSRSFNVIMLDRAGDEIHGYIRWLEPEGDVIQAKFVCVSRCSIAEFL